MEALLRSNTGITFPSVSAVVAINVPEGTILIGYREITTYIMFYARGEHFECK